MIEKSIIIELTTGLQARPAAQFVQEANRFSADLYLEKDGKRVNAKSIMGLMSLAIASGETVTMFADGHDGESAISHLAAFVVEK